MSYIVVVSDNLQNRRLLTKVLTKAAYQVTCFSDAKSTLAHLQQQGADVVILDNEFSIAPLTDILIPNTLSFNVENTHDFSTHLSGNTRTDCHQSDAHLAAKETRKLISTISKHFATPILLLSETEDQENLLDKLKAGADQYLNKPYSEQALLVHIEVLLRRVALEKQRATFDNCTERFSFKISRLPLTDTEVQLVQYLSKNDGGIISKATLQKEVLKRDLSAFDRNLDVHISNIRRKMRNAGLSKLHIKTVHGKGYAFSEKVAQLS